MNFAKFLGTPLITEHLQWLLLNTKKASQLNIVDTKGAQLNTLRNLAMFSLELQLLTMIIVSSLVFFQNVLKLLTSPLHLRRKTNYRLISILSKISQIHERLMHDNMSNYFNDVLSKFQCGFWGGFGPQNCLFYMYEKFVTITGCSLLL